MTFKIENSLQKEMVQVFLQNTDYYLEIVSDDEKNMWNVWLCNKKHFFKRSMYSKIKSRYTLEDLLWDIEEGNAGEEIEGCIKSYNKMFFHDEFTG